jgi:acylphosphatase
MIEERAGFKVQGKVQGVGFRMWVKRTGLELRLRGAVRNRKDGSVELNVAGAPDAVAALERRLSQGPAGARVTGVVRTPSRMPIPSEGFQIEHTE